MSEITEGVRGCEKEDIYIYIRRVREMHGLILLFLPNSTDTPPIDPQSRPQRTLFATLQLTLLVGSGPHGGAKGVLFLVRYSK